MTNIVLSWRLATSARDRGIFMVSKASQELVVSSPVVGGLAEAG